MGVRRRIRLVAVSASVLAVLAGQAGAAPKVGTTCFGQPATIVGTDGDDTLRGTPGNDVIVAGAGSDIIIGLAGDDLICGEEASDFIFGLDGNDQIDGGAGDDSIDPGVGDDKVVDGDGDNLLAFLDAAGPVIASLANGTATGQGNDTFTGMTAIVGGPFNDTLTGDDREFNALAGGNGDDVIDGGGGFDAALFATGPITANLVAGTATGGEGSDTLRGIEGLEGTPQDDNFTGDDGTNVIDGRGGNDTLIGNGGADLIQGDAPTDENPGNDTVDAGTGDDFVQPSLGNDTLDGGPGRQDLLDFTPMSGGVAANLGTGKLSGPSIGNMKLLNFEGLYGSAFGDTLVGDKGPNFILGVGGNDRLAGAAGDDFLSGGDGTDTFDGGSGTDYCLDGKGKGCEFSGTPTGSARAASAYFADMGAASSRLLTLASRGAARPSVQVTAAAVGGNTELGVASCIGSTSRTARSIAGAAAEKRRTSAGPPHRAPATKSTEKGIAPDILPAWLRGPLDVARADTGQLTWQGTLFRFDAKRKAWRSYKKTATAVGQVDPSGTAVWTTATGAPLDRVTLAVPAGQFAWKATLRVPDAPAVTDWIEPHSDFARKGGGIFAPLCNFPG